jgi:hypothetical protein
MEMLEWIFAIFGIKRDSRNLFLRILVAPRTDWKSMFSLRKKEPETDEVERRVARLINQSTPNIAVSYADPRAGNRYNRSLPVMLVPWVGANPSVDETFFAITKDLSGCGLSIAVDRVCDWPKYVVGIRYPEHDPADPNCQPFFVEAHARSACELGGGFWQIGIEFQRLITKPKITDPLESLAMKLLPSHLIENALS